MDTQEETYTLSDSEHINGTNRYTFTYSPHWRRTNGKALSIMIRSVKQILSTRAIWMDGIYISDGTNIMNISPDISLSGSWTKLNKRLTEYKIQQYEYYKQLEPSTKFTYEDYGIAFDENNSRLNIAINPSSTYHLMIDSNKSISPDLLAMCNYQSDPESLMADLRLLSTMVIEPEEFKSRHANDPIEIETDDHNLLKRITFTNIWNRDTLAVHASFVDLSYHQWLGVCNEQYIPPKEYPITFDDQKFWIELFTLDGRPVELPHDQKDQIVIEAMMNSYV